jgi:hypothetical protein
MLTIDECRTKAKECREMAEHAEADHRVMLLHIAETWERICAEVRNKLH